MPYLGINSAVGFGSETTWGTAVARTVWFRLVSEDMRRVVEKRPRGVLAEASASGNIRSHYRAKDTVAGKIVYLAGYEGQGMILQHALWGTPSTTGPSGAIYTHTFLMGSAPPTGGLTIEVIRGNGTAEVFEGCRISKITMEIEAAGLMRVTLDIVGETSGGRVSAGTATYTTNELDIIHSQVGTFSFNAVNYTARRLMIELDNKLAERHLLGSLNLKEPKQGDFREVKVTADAEWESDTLQAAYTADTESDLAFTATGTASRTWAATLHNAYIDDDSAAVSQVGVVPQTTVFRGQSDGTDEGLKIVVANTQSTATAA